MLYCREAIEFCTEYLSNIDAIGIPISANIDQKVGAPIPGGQVVAVDSNLWLHAHHYVLENTTIVQPYIENGIKVDDLGFTLVDFNKTAHKSDPFILASQAKQVFYVQDQHDPRWSVVLSTPQKDFLDRERGDDLVDNFIEHHPFIGALPQVEAFDAMDDSDAICMRGESTVHLTSYLGVLARTMVPITYKTWHVVPKELKDKLWDCIEDYREVQKERRKKHIYNHHLSRKGYAGLEEEMMVASGLTETIDRSILWKKAREKKDGTFDEVAIPVIEKIDKLLKESEENGRSVNGSNDILVEALGTPEYSGRVRAKGKHHTPHQYFNTATDQVVEKPIRRVEDATPPMPIEPQSKVRKCELAMGTKENKVGGGTIILECGPNYLVVVDVPYDASAPLPIPIPGQTTTVGAAIGYQVLWPAHLVSIHTPVLASKKGKKETVNEVEVKSKSEKPQDVKNFEALVGLMLATSRAQPIDFPNDVFGESFKTFLMKEDMDMIISSKEVSSNCILYYIWHLHRKLIDAKQVERYVFVNPVLVSKAGMGEGSKENSFHWVLVALEMKRMIAYYLDPMASQPCDDLKEIVNIQPGSVECGYYVMRYMKEIIANPNQLTQSLMEENHSVKWRLMKFAQIGLC
ncbi:hypothetical protein CK203_060599 [Vitis vinifera]|uniref:DUF4216 domain-containing protein n=1 Tax=Vitis vinifera TaxID=29760 RepID=A0A438GC09_VITVI|nr:hypothetical protein CK203_060599 [Vitis vinifera]